MAVRGNDWGGCGYRPSAAASLIRCPQQELSLAKSTHLIEIIVSQYNDGGNDDNDGVRGNNGDDYDYYNDYEDEDDGGGSDSDGDRNGKERVLDLQNIMFTREYRSFWKAIFYKSNLHK